MLHLEVSYSRNRVTERYESVPESRCQKQHWLWGRPFHWIVPVSHHRFRKILLEADCFSLLINTIAPRRIPLKFHGNLLASGLISEETSFSTVLILLPYKQYLSTILFISYIEFWCCWVIIRTCYIFFYLLSFYTLFECFVTVTYLYVCVCVCACVCGFICLHVYLHAFVILGIDSVISPCESQE